MNHEVYFSLDRVNVSLLESQDMCTGPSEREKQSTFSAGLILFSLCVVGCTLY